MGAGLEGVGGVVWNVVAEWGDLKRGLQEGAQQRFLAFGTAFGGQCLVCTHRFEGLWGRTGAVGRADALAKEGGADHSSSPPLQVQASAREESVVGGRVGGGRSRTWVLAAQEARDHVWAGWGLKAVGCRGCRWTRLEGPGVCYGDVGALEDGP